jgi:hypothetical protein
MALEGEPMMRLEKAMLRSRGELPSVSEGDND